MVYAYPHPAGVPVAKEETWSLRSASAEGASVLLLGCTWYSLQNRSTYRR
jgi:hypothetical protein